MLLVLKVMIAVSLPLSERAASSSCVVSVLSILGTAYLQSFANFLFSALRMFLISISYFFFRSS